MTDCTTGQGSFGVINKVRRKSDGLVSTIFPELSNFAHWLISLRLGIMSKGNMLLQDVPEGKGTVASRIEHS
jgi:hypothetical protein